jgi:hypothetical protein
MKEKAWELKRQRKKRLEALEINGLIRFGRPLGEIPYNCYHLTEKGKTELERLS